MASPAGWGSAPGLRPMSPERPRTFGVLTSDAMPTDPPPSDLDAEVPSRAPSVELPSPLHDARFVRRPNRFVVYARLEDPDGAPSLPSGFSAGDEVVCHLADPGRLNELLVADRRLLLRHAPEPHRKTKWSVVVVQTPADDGWISVDTTLPNRLVEKALRARALEELAGWRLERTEFAHGRSRLDFLLSDGGGRMLALEVKSVTLVEDGVALFPDAVTARGARHVEELGELAARSGWEAAVLFVCQRSDASRIEAAWRIDPDFAETLAAAKEAGVRVLGRRCRVDRRRVVLGERVPAS